MFDLASTSFAAVSAYVSWLLVKIVKPPNEPRIRGRDFRDAISSEMGVAFVQIFPWLVLALLLWQSALSLCGHRVGTDACPLHPSLSQRKSFHTALFTWNTWSVLVYAIMIPASLLRLRAFSDLGKDFTFELQKSAKLQTGGVYQYIQHPSYTGLLAVLAVAIPWYSRPDGILALILPVEVLDFMTTYRTSTLIGEYLLVAAIFSIRLRDEEALMKEHFGQEWITWHTRTARLIPFIF